MKKRLTILTCFMVLCSFVFGQSHWGNVDDSPFDNYMNAVVSIQIDGVQQNASDIEIGAFCDGDLRGYSKISTMWGQYVCWFGIYGTQGDNITYRLWVPGTETEPGKELFTDFTTKFDSEVSVGQYDPYIPQVINFFTPVAEVDGVKYPTIEAAIAAAEEGDEIDVITDIELESPITIAAAKNVVLDLNGFTVVYNSTTQNEAMITNYGTLVIKDNEVGTGVINYNYTGAADNTYSKGNYTISNCGTLTVEGGKITIANLSGHAKYSIDNNSTTGDAILVIKGGHLYNYNTCAIRQFCNSTTNQNSVKIEGGLIEGYNAIWMQNPGSKKVNGQLTITGGEIRTTASKYVSGELTIPEVSSEIYCSIHGTGGSWDANSAIAITGGIINENVNLNEDQTPASVTIDEEGATFNGRLLTPVAAVDGVAYSTLEKAMTSAETASVLLIRDAQGSGIVIDKPVTIDFGGFTYSFTADAVGSTGTATNGFQIKASAEDVVLKNGTLNVAAEAANNYAMLIQNYANLTITDMTLEGENLDRSSVSYVLSNNSGEVNINGETSIIANQEGPANNFAFDSYKDKNYDAPTVTVNTTGVIKGAVEVSATLNLEAVGTDSQMDVRITGNGQLYNKVAVRGSMTKKVEGTTEGWGTISSPVGTIEHSTVTGLITEDTHDLYRYNEETMIWENVKDQSHTDFHTLDKGVGYLYANTADTDVVFTGTFNAENYVEQSLAYTSNELAGFHFVGNPFTHSINEKHLTATNAQLASGFYAVTAAGALESRTSGTIAPMESVMIKTNGSTVLHINKYEPTSEGKRGISENNGQLKINVSNSEYSDVAYVSFNEGLGLDKINHRNAEIPMVYVPVDGINYAVATMNQDVTEIPVSFQAMTMGQYTIGVEAQDCEYAMMTLVDRFTGEETNLLLEDYSFIAKTNDSAERFIIKLALANGNGNGNENFAFINNGMMYIYNIEGQGMVNVYDVTGRPVAEYNVATSANISTSDFAAGVYIIRMSDENGVRTQKIVIE